MQTRQSKNINTGNGAVRRLRFSPGKQNLKLISLHLDCVGIWDVKVRPNTQFWEVACRNLEPTPGGAPLSNRHDLLVDSDTFLERQMEKVKLHLNRVADSCCVSNN